VQQGKDNSDEPKTPYLKEWQEKLLLRRNSRDAGQPLNTATANTAAEPEFVRRAKQLKARRQEMGNVA